MQRDLFSPAISGHRQPPGAVLAERLKRREHETGGGVVVKVVLLEHPRGRSARHFNTVVHTPLFSSLLSGYIASLLREQGIETELLDRTDRRDDFFSVAEEVAGVACDILGVHLIYSWDNNPRVLEMIAAIGARREGPIVAYGFYPTFACEYLLRTCHALDGVMWGEPEMTFLEFCSVARRGGDFSSVKGFACRRAEECIVNGGRELIKDLDALPFPHRTEALLAKSGGTILGSRGCYGSCSFCHINSFYGKEPKWRGRSAENIYAEVKTLLPVLAQKYIYFVDANFFGPGEEGQGRAEKIAETLQEEAGLAFGLECRVNDVHEQSLGRLVRAGLRDVFLGIESGSQRCLDRMNKRTTLQQNAAALSLLRDYGIEPQVGFIMFEADSTLEDLRSNLTFLKSHNLLGRLTTTVDLLYHPEIVLMGTGTYGRWESTGRVDCYPRSPYQVNYGFKEPGVQVCANILSPVCEHLLALMDKPHSPLYWRHLYRAGGNPAAGGMARELNQWLVSLFEDLLVRMQSEPGIVAVGWQHRFIDDALAYIDGMLSHSSPLAEGSSSSRHG